MHRMAVTGQVSAGRVSATWSAGQIVVVQKLNCQSSFPIRVEKLPYMEYLWQHVWIRWTYVCFGYFAHVEQFTEEKKLFKHFF